MIPVRRQGQPPEQAKEIAAWDAIKDSTDPVKFIDFLRKHPNGSFATVARMLIDQLEKQRRAEQAALEQDHKRREEAKKAGEITRLEEQRRNEAAKHQQDLSGAEQAKNAADMLIVASGRSARHVGALADHLMRKLKDAGAKQIRVEGMPGCDWVLVDAGWMALSRSPGSISVRPWGTLRAPAPAFCMSRQRLSSFCMSWPSSSSR